MDNQQETLDPFKLGWIVGVIEGEGTIGIHNGAGKGSAASYKPVIKIFNTDKDFIARCHEYLEEFGIPHYIYISNPKIVRLNKRYRELYQVTIAGFKRVKIATEILKPEMFSSKSEQLRILTELVNDRLSTPMTRQNFGRSYTDKQLSQIEAIKQLNQRGKGSSILNDYTQSTANNAAKI